jgi:hypothetical protein
MDIIKQQLKVSQDQYAQMSNLILNLTTQLASKPAAKPESETSPKKDIAPKKDDTLKMDTSFKDDTSKDTDDNEAEL